MIEKITVRNWVGAVTALLLVAGHSSAMASGNVLFGQQQTSSDDISAFTKWTAIMPRYEQQKESVDSECTEDTCSNVKWEKLLSELDGKPIAEQIAEVNKFFNAMPFVTDQENWGVADFWATPYEIMDRGGDCEDYAIAKYISLQRLGVSTDDLRIMIVHDGLRGGEMHAVLEVTVDDTRYILDNQNKRVLAENRISRYRPIYAINESKWWAYQ